ATSAIKFNPFRHSVVFPTKAGRSTFGTPVMVISIQDGDDHDQNSQSPSYPDGAIRGRQTYRTARTCRPSHRADRADPDDSPTRVAHDRSSGGFDDLRHGGQRRIPAPVLSHATKRGVGSRRGGSLAETASSGQ